MAACEMGYLCEVCGKDVEDLTDSDLYLRFLLGEVDPETLHIQPERHIRCNPVLAQFLVVAGFEPVRVDGAFAKANLDPAFVAEEEERVGAAFARLAEVAGLEGLSIVDYLPPEVARRWSRDTRANAS